MRKHLVRILLILIICLLAAGGSLLYSGHKRYLEETELLPIEEAVEQYTAKENYVTFENIDEDFINAVISVEDKRFFERKGYDLIALCQALYHNFLAKDLVEGASTISEQIAKNLYLGGYVNGLEEKTAEIYIMLELEKTYSKQELFALYANMNYYGDGYWGIKDAAWGYYKNDPADLSLGEAAMLAGIPNAPAVYQLSSGYDLAKQRQAWVLQTMYSNGYISEEEKDLALKEDVCPK